MQVEENIPLAPMTSFGIGGRARYFAHAKTTEDLEEARRFAAEHHVPLLMLGGGSNVLIADEGFRGLVVKMELTGISIEVSETPLLAAAAGESWDEVVARAVSERLWGIENLSGIPGTFGGAVVQNIGAYGAAISEVTRWVEVWDSDSGEIRRLEPHECAFEYRDSVFKHTGNLIVTRAALKLARNGTPNITYRDLAQYFQDKTPTLAEIREAVIAIRKGKFPDLTSEGSAGSFFKNPMLPKAAAELLQQKYPGMPLFDMPESANVKVPLAWLLDKVLHFNGLRLGKARLFERQPIVITADRGATPADVRALAEHVRSAVRERFGFEIEEEVKIIT
jgi:UDP-N-acetylmuramate dehydrogenase